MDDFEKNRGTTLDLIDWICEKNAKFAQKHLKSKISGKTLLLL